MKAEQKRYGQVWQSRVSCPRCALRDSRVDIATPYACEVHFAPEKASLFEPVGKEHDLPELGLGVQLNLWCSNCCRGWFVRILLGEPGQQVDRIECKGTLGDLVQDDPALMPTVSEPPSSKLYETVDATAASRESEDKRMGRVQFDVPVNVPATRSDPMHEFAEDIRAVFERHGFSVGTPAFSGLLAAIAVVEEGKGSGEGEGN